MLDGETLPPFVPGANDQPAKIRITDALVGREHELAQLSLAFDLSRSERSRVVAIQGWSGVGKTRLVQELIPAVTAERGALVVGKHELLGRGVPYAGLAQAFGNWIRRVVADPVEAAHAVRDRVREALGDGAGVLGAIVPELALLLGRLPEAEPLPPAEAEMRVAVLFRALIRGISGASRPLVVFLDDLQWCDSATLQVIGHVATDPGSRNVLIVVAWRDNEVAAGHPVFGLLDELQADGAEVSSIVLGPLSAGATQEFVARSLRAHRDDVREIAQVVYGASGGSPFYASRLLLALEADRALTFDGQRWQLDQAAEALASTPEDAAHFLKTRLLRTSAQTQRALCVGAWVGSQFSLVDVAAVLDLSWAETAALLEDALNIDAIVRTDDSPVELLTIGDSVDARLSPRYRFVHDRVQQAASELLDAAERPALRLAIARLLARESGGREYEAVDHAAAAGALLADPEERLRFARIAGAAARRAIEAAAFSVAGRAFELAIEWAGADAWTAQPALRLELALGAAEASYLVADREKMEVHVANVLARSVDALTRLRAEEIAGLAHISANEMGAAIDRVAVAINGAGMRLPKQPSMLDVVSGLVKAKWALRGHSDDRLAELPLCEDALVNARMRLEALLFSPSFYGRPLLFPVLAFTIVRETIAHGITDQSPLGLVVYGIVLCTTGDIERGIAYGRVALRLNDRLHDRRLRHRTEHVWNAHLRFWFQPWQTCRDDLTTIHRACWESGDIEYAAFAAFMSCTLGLHTGEPLPELHARNARAIAAIRSMGQQTALHTTMMHHQIIENLMGLAPEPTRLVGEAYNEDTMEAVHQAAQDKVNLHCLAVSRAVVGVLFGEMERAAAEMRVADAWDQDAKSQPIHVAGRFYDALAHAAIGDLRRARKRLADLRKWARLGGSNLDHRVALVEAEMAATRGRSAQATAAWERAFALAEANGFAHERALGLERAALFHERQRNLVLARSLLLEARVAYERWGARARLASLEARLLTLGRAAPESSRPRRAAGTTTSTTTRSISVGARSSGAFADVSGSSRASSGAEEGVTSSIPRREAGNTSDADSAPLDLEALLGAARRIAAEVEKSRVASALLEGALVLAGGTSATLYRVEGDEFRPVIRAVADEDGVRANEVNESSAQSAVLADALRGGVPIVVADSTHPLFGDPLLREAAARSAVAVPILHSGVTKNVLVVANALMEHAFPARRLAPLQALAAQAGIAIENAQHYEELDNRVRERTAELITARRDAEAERDRADRILLNVLPEPIADELKRTGRAQPVSAPSATVLFTDFAGFTQLASEMSAEDLVAQLERCFAAFDDIVDRHDVTKLKTIGDAYMAVGGLPIPSNTHAVDVVRAGLEMAAWIAAPDDGGPPIPFRVRIGVHTGPLVAGVIGKRRFLYDVWGDTVNIAARMESSGEPGRVNISRQTRGLIGDLFVVEARGLVKAKGKGELEMYFVERMVTD